MNKKRGIILVFAIILICGFLTFSFAGSPTELEIKFYSSTDVEYLVQTTKDGKIVKPQDPVREGYTFVGWYTVDDELFDFDTKVSKDTSLVAKWSRVNNNDTNITDSDTNVNNSENDVNNSSVINNENNIINDDVVYVNYVVRHYLMNYDGVYDESFEEFTYTGRLGNDVIGEVKSYIGYDSPSSKSIRLSNDSNVIDYYYPLKRFSLNIETDKGISSVLGVGIYYYGQIVNLGYTVKAGYTIGSISNSVVNNQIIMDSDKLIEITTTPNDDTLYTVKHYLMDLNGEYNEEASLVEEFKGTTDTFVTVPVKDVKGFISPLEESYNINGDGSLVVEYYYERNSYDINFVTNSDEVIDSLTKYYQEEIGELPVLVREGYTFVGWYLDENLDTLYDLVEMPGEDITLYAKWEANSDTPYKVEYYVINLNGEWELVDSEVKYGTSGSEVTPEYKDIDGFTKASEEESVIINGDGSSVVSYYYFRNRYQVKFNANGGKFGIYNKYLYYGESLDDFGEATKDGYDFVGWYVDEELTEELPEVMPYSDLTLYAKWSPRTDTVYKVRYRFMNTEGKYDLTNTDSDIVREYTGETDSTVTPEPEDFEGFTTPTSLKSAVVKGNGTTEIVYNYSRKRYMFNANVVLINSESSSSSLKPATITPISSTKNRYYDSEEIMTLDIHVNPGYKFVSYEVEDSLNDYGITENYENSENSYYDITFKYIVKDYANVTVYVEPIKYNISYELNGGEYEDGVTNPDYYTSQNRNSLVLNEPIRDGYKFDGWYIEDVKLFSNKFIYFNGSGDVVVSAKWIEKADYPYTVNYYVMNANGEYELQTNNKFGSLSKPIESSSNPAYLSSTLFNIPTTKVVKNVIDGEEVVSEVGILDDVMINSNGSTVIEYYYERLTANIRFFNYGDNAIESYTLYRGARIGELPVPTKFGYEFKGWYRDSAFTRLHNEDDVVGNGALNIYFYGKWEKVDIPMVDYKIIYKYMNEDGEWDDSLTEEVIKSDEMGKTVTLNPTSKTGYETPTSQTKVISEDGTTQFVFEYKRKELNVSINTSDVEGILDVSGDGTYLYGSKALLTVNLKEGYDLDGWYLNSAKLSTKLEYERVIYTNQELTLKTTYKKYTITYVNGGKSSNPTSYTLEDEITFENPTKSGYDFVNYTDEAGNVITGISKGSTGNISVTANWVPRNDTPFTVVYRFMGVDGTWFADREGFLEYQETMYGTTGSNPLDIVNQLDLSKEHFKAPVCSGSSTISATGTSKITCRYTRERNDLTYISEYGSVIQTSSASLYYDSTQSVTYRVIPKTGYKFVGVTPLDDVNDYDIVLDLDNSTFTVNYKVLGDGELKINYEEAN